MFRGIGKAEMDVKFAATSELLISHYGSISTYHHSFLIFPNHPFLE